ncbi:MAG: MBL fold metallo-hydrolase [Bacteroidales bacterium]|nr:MBL fold metallo-hydrolase [Bacteroidales bacterium]
MAAEITYLDNSGFLVELPDVLLVFDYYRDPAHSVTKALQKYPEKPVIFFVTHNHSDHFNTEIFNLGQSHRRLYVLSNDIPTREIHDTMPIDWMSRGDTLEDLPGGLSVKAYGSTDAGVSYLVTRSDGFRIFHAGDLNLWHWDKESTPREVAKANDLFNTELHRISSEVDRIDVAFFPVDVRQGANCAAGAQEFIKTIAVRDFFPMHYKGDYEQALYFATYNLPEKIVERTNIHCLHKPGETVSVDC